MSSQTQNTAWTIPSSASKVSDLTKQIFAIPSPGPNQVLVKITAASLNFRDVLISTRSRYYPGDHKANLIPGSDGAGIIHATHPSSSWKRKEGKKVILHCNGWITGDMRNLDFGSVFGGMSQDGTLQEYIVVDDSWIIDRPEGMSAVEGAALVTAGTTAWSAIRSGIDMRMDGELEAWKGAWTDKRLDGKTVLTMGTGGVSCFAIQIAAALGATVIATSSSVSKLDVAKSLGAAHVVDYAQTPDWEQEVLRLTDGRGVDHVVETGGAGTLMKSIASTRSGGQITLLGILTPNAPIPAEFTPSVLFGAKTIRGQTGFSRDAVAELSAFVAAHSIQPVIAQEFAFSDMVAAFEALQKQNSVGKIVVKIADE
ncbi:alcohol dehydrogenase superfamily, zinc-containing protein [Ophiobolus disseminans]|uniref:Alcohol dehydrogenase superfamily, zinc-containing protein n=1 Tax=Ophiobolus disseminans TaxID=1469910 RepID=A0A6A7AB28_9PLEO|nr:alcohol dehydrogenase superfamily, zinc-containing protein [Ophiobolus disseminans]